MGTTTSRENNFYSVKVSTSSRRKDSTSTDSNCASPTLTIEPKRNVRQPIPVKLIKHQVVLSDHVPPMSSLSAVTSIPVRRSSWIKNNTSYTSSSSFYDDDDDELVSSPRTSLGSQDHGFLKEEYKKKKKSSSFYPFISKSNHQYNNKNESDIIFESRYVSSPSLTSKETIPILLKGPRRPFWHYVLKHILDGNIHVPVAMDKPITVLDAACGAGFWTLDIAHTFPNAKVIGLDAFPVDDKRMKGHSNTISAPNIVYKYGDLTTHLPLPDNYLDIIYQRDTTSIMPHERWPFLLDELMRVAKPGGYIELVEYSFVINNPGPVLALVNEWYKIVTTSIGVDPKEAKHLKHMMITAGFQDVDKKVITVPIGEWPEDEDEREKGFLYKQVIKALFKSMKSWWISELAISAQEYDKVVTDAMDEFDEQCCSLDWVIYTARKPFTSF
ncbi:S-adenosyl-L-methionine-dependent methyltransferase [Thamnidium elegans]|nr:S-adenosyl-L-methionine-dependent methyltransferase [Thamnidium elegans]